MESDDSSEGSSFETDTSEETILRVTDYIKQAFPGFDALRRLPLSGSDSFSRKLGQALRLHSELLSGWERRPTPMTMLREAVNRVIGKVKSGNWSSV
jgi:hypothetical protein